MHSSDGYIEYPPNLIIIRTAKYFKILFFFYIIVRSGVSPRRDLRPQKLLKSQFLSYNNIDIL